MPISRKRISSEERNEWSKWEAEITQTDFGVIESDLYDKTVDEKKN